MLKSTLLLLFCAAAATVAALPTGADKAPVGGTPKAADAVVEGSGAVPPAKDEPSEADNDAVNGSGQDSPKPDGPSKGVVKGPFTEHFMKFLKADENAKKYVVDIAFDQHNDDYGSFGGKEVKDEKVTKRPVIFIHGNSDYALRRKNRTTETGWTETVAYFKKNGYTGAELYGLTYGSGDVGKALNNSITCEYAKTHRSFIDAILKYTGKTQVDVIAHSMGATIARMVLQGGTFTINKKKCELGPSLKDKVRTLVSISGAHYGMCLCLGPKVKDVASCGPQGFAPGECSTGQCPKEQTFEECLHYEASAEERASIYYSDLLEQVNKGSVGNKEAERIVSIFSKDDDILGEGNKAWGKQTSVPPGNELVKEFAVYDHFQTKDFTAATQFYLVSFDTW